MRGSPDHYGVGIVGFGLYFPFQLQDVRPAPVVHGYFFLAEDQKCYSLSFAILGAVQSTPSPECHGQMDGQMT